MKPISEMTDRCLAMKPHELFSWEDWWANVIKDGTVPTHKTFAYAKFIEKRNRAKQEINKELGRRKRPERLFCPGVGQGVYLVNEKDVSEMITDKRVRKIVRCFENSHKEMGLLALCSRISDTDRKMLNRVSDLIELQQNTMIGTISKMKSLPPATKKRLLKHLGYKS